MDIQKIEKVVKDKGSKEANEYFLLSKKMENISLKSLQRNIAIENDMWIKNANVKAALHVAEDAFFFSGDNGVGFTYNSTESSV